jgi:3-methyladenine DNA glycosylase AlkD
MDVAEIMSQLKQFGNADTKRIFMNHGAKEPIDGVKVGDLKKIVKKVKKDHDLSLKLYETGHSDAMYLAGLIADEKQITKEQLNQWLENASWYMLSEYTVGAVAAETPFATELANEWIESKDEMIASAGWATYANYISFTENSLLNISEIQSKLELIESTIHNQENRVRYTMNGFVIAAGTYIPELSNQAQEIGNKIGKVKVYMGNTSCKVPYSPDYIQKVKDKNKVGNKRKAARC